MSIYDIADYSRVTLILIYSTLQQHWQYKIINKDSILKKHLHINMILRFVKPILQCNSKIVVRENKIWRKALRSGVSEMGYSHFVRLITLLPANQSLL